MRDLSELRGLFKGLFIEKIVVRNVLSSHLWIMGACIIFIIFLVFLRANEIFIYISFFMFAVVLFHYLHSFDYFKKKDPNKLLSETIFYKILKMENMGIKGSEKSADIIEGEVATENIEVEVKKITKRASAR